MITMGGRRRLLAGCTPLTICLHSLGCVFSWHEFDGRAMPHERNDSGDWESSALQRNLEDAGARMVPMLDGERQTLVQWIPEFQKPVQSLKPPKAHTILKFTESTQALKARKRTRGPNEITIQNKAPRQCPGNTPSSKGSGMAPGPCLGAQRRKIRLFKTIDLGEVIYKELATRL